jgi:hypothetical protein
MNEARNTQQIVEHVERVANYVVRTPIGHSAEVVRQPSLSHSPFLWMSWPLGVLPFVVPSSITIMNSLLLSTT